MHHPGEHFSRVEKLWHLRQFKYFATQGRFEEALSTFDREEFLITLNRPENAVWFPLDASKIVELYLLCLNRLSSDAVGAMGLTGAAQPLSVSAQQVLGDVGGRVGGGFSCYVVQSRFVEGHHHAVCRQHH